MESSPTIEDVRAAARRIDSRIHRTPVARCRAVDASSGCEIHLKCENLQKVGAFKARGAMNAVLLLEEKVAQRGVVTHSSGNHAQALAWAARERGIPAHIVMPTNAPAVKRRAVEGYGGVVHECRPTLESRLAECERVAQETGGTVVPPYDDHRVIAGQGTLALELIAQVPDLEAIVVPVGGGGMISGVATVVKAIAPEVRILGVEPALVDDARRSVELGSIQPHRNDPTKTIADGLRTTLGERTFPIIRDLVDEIVTVEESEIRSALRLVLERSKLVIEPSAAVGVAATLQPSFRRRDHRRVGVVLCGGNLDLAALPGLLGDS
ncbi:MAG: pyridoxal-phosphate dependent enzyme [Planctomycetota bacterium]|nr:pyridoxal-phosphate dependent enzyme [Planctomycetota bacterium]